MATIQRPRPVVKAAVLLRRYAAGERDFRHENFSWADLHGADLRDADFTWAIFRFADLCGADFRGCSLRWADFRGADVRRMNTARADLDWAAFRGADLGEDGDAEIGWRGAVHDRASFLAALKEQMAQAVAAEAEEAEETAREAGTQEPRDRPASPLC